MAAGDSGAFAAFYDDLAPAVHGVVRRVLRDPSRSEEVTQEVFVEIWRSAGRFDRTLASARTWVLTIAHRRAVDAVRREQRQRDRIEREMHEPALYDAPDPSSVVVGGFERRRVRDAMQQLTDLQRQSIELAYFGGMSQSQIAGALDVPLGTVKTRVRDGLVRLRDHLGVNDV